MKSATMILSLAALVVLLAATCGYAGGYLSETANQRIMLAATLAWLVAAPFWMSPEKHR